MAIDMVKDIKPVSELKTHTRDVVHQARTTGRPVVITVNGQPAVVMIEVSEYQRQQDALNLAAMVAAGEADVAAGRTRPMSEFMKERGRGGKVRR